MTNINMEDFLMLSEYSMWVAWNSEYARLAHNYPSPHLPHMLRETIAPLEMVQRKVYGKIKDHGLLSAIEDYSENAKNEWDPISFKMWLKSYMDVIVESDTMDWWK